MHNKDGVGKLSLLRLYLFFMKKEMSYHILEDRGEDKARLVYWFLLYCFSRFLYNNQKSNVPYHLAVIKDKIAIKSLPYLFKCSATKNGILKHMYN